MEALDFTRSRALNNIPAKKLQNKLDSIQEGSEAQDIKIVKLIAINRYAESNIPVEYWSLTMEKDFVGDPRLKTKYDEYVLDMKKSYQAASSICFAGNHGLGKQLSLDTELPTPLGFIKLIDLKEGDQLFDEHGDICNVTKLHPINLSPQSYRIIFDDGTEVEACADHQWLTNTRNNRLYGSQPTVKTTKEIFNTLQFKNGKISGSNHSIPCCAPIKYPVQNLLIDPYTLGCWLGDGTSRNGDIECADQEILDNIKLAGYSVNLFKSTVGKSKSCRYRIGDLIKNDLVKTGHHIGQLCYQLKQLNLLNNKHIPDVYLHSSYKQRLDLLQGLMDTDGCCLKGGLSEYCTKLPELAAQIAELVRSLGIKCNIKKNEAWLYDKRCADRYRIAFTTQLPIFRLQRKLNNIRLDKKQLNRTKHRYITDIQPIESKAMRCITVDSPSHLFLITHSFIATHNTMTATCILKKASQKGYSCLYTTLSDIVAVLTQATGEDKFLARQELMKVDFLVIDEFDPRFMATENAADLYARSLESVFRARSQNKLPTLMCTNSPNVIESFTGPLKASIGSLIKGYLKIFAVLGDDFRKKDDK
jgi:hypothetical protein